MFKYEECQTYVKHPFLSLFFNRNRFNRCQPDDSQNESKGSEGKRVSHGAVIASAQ